MIQESFERIRAELFHGMVLIPAMAAVPDGYALGDIATFIKIDAQLFQNGAVMINREKGAECGYWDYPQDKVGIEINSAELHFIDLFDWNSYGTIDMGMVMGVIARCPDDPELEGRRFLLKILDVNDMVIY